MYAGMPGTHSGTFNMTTISLKSALEGMGDANNGYSSKSFTQFCNSIDGFRERVQAQYAGTHYPQGTYDANGINLSGTPYNPELGTVNKYSADVLIPAFLSAYTSGSGSSLDIFPTLRRMLPNWPCNSADPANCHGCATTSRASTSTTLTKVFSPWAATPRTAHIRNT